MSPHPDDPEERTWEEDDESGGVTLDHWVFFLGGAGIGTGLTALLAWWIP